MKEYDTKSIDELRYEDYMANRKGPQEAGMLEAGPQQVCTTLGTIQILRNHIFGLFLPHPRTFLLDVSVCHDPL